MSAYYAAIFLDEGKYSVFFPDVPGCQTWGHTVEEAFDRAIDALAGHLGALADDGDPIPPPSNLATARKKWRHLCIDMELEIEQREKVMFQLIPAPELDLVPVRVSVSFKRYVLNMIDRKAEAAGMTRSGFLASLAVTAPGDASRRSHLG